MMTITRELAAGAVVGVLLGAGAAPAAAAPQGPVLSGTYDIIATYKSATVNEVVTLASDCPQCNATVTSNGKSNTMTWNGIGWEGTWGGGCGPATTVYTPSGDVDGVVKNFTVLGTYLTPEVCGINGPTVGTGTRIE